MKVNLNAVIMTLDGKPFKTTMGAGDVLAAMLAAGMKPAVAENTVNGLAPFMDDKGAKSEDMTFRSAAINALGRPDGEVDGSEFLDRISLADRIIEAGDGVVEIDADKDKKRILACVKRAWENPVIYTRFNQLFVVAEAAEIKAKEKSDAKKK